MDLLDPSLYAAVRRPLLEASGLPPGCYHDPAFYEAEMRHVFRRGWLLVGRLDEVANPGDFLVADLADASVILVRDNDGAVHVLANACTHRGTRLATGRGTTRAFRCPYHSWTFGLDGALRGAGGMEQAEGFSLEDWPLAPVRHEVWGGFVFATLDADAPPLASWLGNLPPRLAMYGFGDMVATWRAEYEVACNWKLWVENFMEGYHIATVHTRTLSGQKVVNIPEDPGPGEVVWIYERHEGTRALLRGDAGFPSIETLEGDSAQGSRFILIYPNTMLAVTVDAAWSLVAVPTGPETCRIVATYLFPRGRTEREDFAEVAPLYYKRVDITLPEDNEICAVQQRGLRSPLARPGRFSHKEKIVHALDNWILDRVLPAGAPLKVAAE